VKDLIQTKAAAVGSAATTQVSISELRFCSASLPN